MKNPSIYPLWMIHRWFLSVGQRLHRNQTDVLSDNIRLCTSQTDVAKPEVFWDVVTDVSPIFAQTSMALGHGNHLQSLHLCRGGKFSLVLHQISGLNSLGKALEKMILSHPSDTKDITGFVWNWSGLPIRKSPKFCSCSAW